MVEPRRTRITLAHVAEAAGVAESTASRILNGYSKQFRVRQEVRDRVIESAERLGYKPNPIVRSIAAKRTNLVAVVGWPMDASDQAMLGAAVSRLNAAGKHVGTTFLRAERAGHDLPSWRFDGALVLHAGVREAVEALEADGIPYVSLLGVRGDLHGDTVGYDRERSVGMALSHLTGLGHRRAALLSPRLPEGIRASEPESLRALWRTAWSAGCARAGVADTASVPGEASELGEFLASTVRDGVVTAVACDSDAVGSLVLQAAAQEGLRVPDELSVIALTENIPARLSTPRMTAVRQPSEACGEAAADLLLERLDGEGRTSPRDLCLAPELVEGESTSRAARVPV